MSKVNKLIEFDKKISNTYKIKTLFGETINGTYAEFKKIADNYWNFFIKHFSDIKMKLYYIDNHNKIYAYFFLGDRYIIQNMMLNATLTDDVGYKIILNKTIPNVTLTLDTFTPPNNVTKLINKDYYFDNVNI